MASTSSDGVQPQRKARLVRAFLRLILWQLLRAISKSAGMETYESQFRAIVGHNYAPNQELDAKQSCALTALIFGMPDCEVHSDKDTIKYHGWCFQQQVYMAVTVTRDHTHGAEAICSPLDVLNG